VAVVGGFEVVRVDHQAKLGRQVREAIKGSFVVSLFQLRFDGSKSVLTPGWRQCTLGSIALEIIERDSFV
jgi:hypothetical protein